MIIQQPPNSAGREREKEEERGRKTEPGKGEIWGKGKAEPDLSWFFLLPGLRQNSMGVAWRNLTLPFYSDRAGVKLLLESVLGTNESLV